MGLFIAGYGTKNCGRQIPIDVTAICESFCSPVIQWIARSDSSSINPGYNYTIDDIDFSFERGNWNIKFTYKSNDPSTAKSTEYCSKSNIF